MLPPPDREDQYKGGIYMTEPTTDRAGATSSRSGSHGTTWSEHMVRTGG